MSITDSQCRAAKPGEKQYKLADGHGLFLLVMPTGTKTWYRRHYVDGRQRDERIGTYPETSLADARRRREATRGRLESDVPLAPSAGRERLFRNVAEEWFEKQYRPTVAEQTAKERWGRIKNHLLPHLGDMDIGAITAKDVLDALKACRRAYTARRTRGLAEEIFNYAEIPYDVPSNPATQRLNKSLPPAPPEQNRPALPFGDLPDFYVKLRTEKCKQAQDDQRTRLAVELILHTVLRTKELRFGRWTQIIGDEWHLPAEQMKKVNGVQLPHIVPLTSRALEILDELRPFARNSVMIFPGLRPGKVMSENTMGNWMKARGYQGIATIHGFRSTFDTWAHESGRWQSEWIETCLAHADRNPVRAAYNKAKYLDQRREIMCAWSDFLDAQEAAGVEIAIERDVAELFG